MSQQRIIWFAIVMSTVIYLVLALHLAPGEGGDFDASASRTPVPMLYGAALLIFLFGWFGVQRIVRGNAQTKLILAMAIFEACAILGLGAALITPDWRLYLPPWALALIGFIGAFPRESSRTAP